MNDSIMKIQYCIFMLVFFVIFIVVSIILIPVAWVMGIIDKLKHPSKDKVDNIVNMSFFIIGPVILVFDVIADLYYFWLNNFRQNLLQNIIAKEISQVTHKSLRELDYYSKFMILNKIKSLTTGYLIRHFRGKLNCQQNIQFLLYGQWIPKGGFRGDG